MSQMTDFLENRLIDFLFRGQPLGIAGASAAASTGPTTLYVGLFTTMPTDSSGGTEVPGGTTGYQRVGVNSTLNNWAGTQGIGANSVSVGSTGTTSNNVPFQFPAPGSTAWGTVVGFGIFDSLIGGNLLLYGSVNTPKLIGANADAPQFNAASLSVMFS